MEITPWSSFPADVAMPTCSEQLLSLPSSAPSCIVLAVTEPQKCAWDTEGPDYYLPLLEDVDRSGEKNK